jgi:hypothetical protein
MYKCEVLGEKCVVSGNKCATANTIFKPGTSSSIPKEQALHFRAGFVFLRKGNVIYFGTLTKTFAPAVRLGFNDLLKQI